MLHTAQVPIGGAACDARHRRRALSTPIDNAERLKTLYGNAHASPDDEREILAVQLIGEEDHQFAKIPRSMVVGIIKPRLEETFEMVRDRLDGAGLGRAAGSRVVLTGGASQLVGVRDLAARKFSTGRCGSVAPPVCAGLPESASRPGLCHRRSACCPGRPAKAARCTISIWSPSRARAAHAPPDRRFSA